MSIEENDSWFPECQKWIVRFKNRVDFNTVTDWDLKALCYDPKDEPEIGYSDMSITWFNREDKVSFVGCVIMNHIKEFEEN